jgi:putative GTP pyrophosphokinase
MYSRNQLNKAGNILITSKSEIEVENALDMINQWRANHLHPLRVLKNNSLKLLELN